MDRSRSFVVATFLAAIFIAPAAVAQTPVNLSIVSGNGQITCPECTLAGFGRQNFDPLIVKVTDANGNAVPNASVNWTVVAGQALIGPVGQSLANATQTVQTTTDVNGNASVQAVIPFLGSGSAAVPYVTSNVSANISNSTVNFFMTVALANTSATGNTSVLVQVLDLTPASTPVCTTCINPGDTLTGAAGSTSATQFEISVYAPGSVYGIVPNVSLRLISNQGSPTISCATGAGADPGSVLIDQNGNAICNAILGSTTGFGSFYAPGRGRRSQHFGRGATPSSPPATII